MIYYNHLFYLIKEILKFNTPVDLILKNYYKKHKSLGKNSRKLISDLVFLLLRNFEKINTALSINNSLNIDSYIKSIYYVFDKNIIKFLSEPEEKYLSDLQNLNSSNNINIVSELPLWIIEKLKINYSAIQIIRLGKFLNSIAPLDLRVNTLKTNVNYVLNELKNNKINAEKTRYSPWGIRIKDKISILENKLYVNGLIEIQDEGSQLVSYFVKARPSDLVIDLCAGAGGKALSIGVMMKNKGRIYAFDTSLLRLKGIENRILKSGLNNIFFSVIKEKNDKNLLKFRNKADIVLIDSPCSGLGTLRRNPDLKYRYNNKDIEKFVLIQQNLLSQGANLVKIGGKLIYSTCSILTQENELQIKNFLFNNKNYIIKNCGNLLSNIKMELKSKEFLFFNPEEYDMDGFFIAVLEKIY